MFVLVRRRSWAAGGAGAGPMVLGRLVGEGVDEAVAYLEQAAPTKRRSEGAGAEVLAAAIPPDEADTDEMRAWREVVFRWVWDLAESAE